MNTIQQKKFSLLLRVCVSVVLIGALFKIMHWPYSSPLIITPIIGILIVYPIRFFLKSKKDSMDYIKLAMVILWCLIYGIRVFHLYSPPIVFNIILALLFGWWFINQGTDYITIRKLKTNKTVQFMYYLVVVFSIACVFLGAIFKIQHWPYSNILMTLGIISTSILIIIDYFVRE
ncbi:hypothetical protein [Olleya sp. R77988]|uniref:GldL-related protein n=1 Tax=Olleya sp. R77988 TaxID=3093875 RepID=UPI0037C96297